MSLLSVPDRFTVQRRSERRRINVRVQYRRKVVRMGANVLDLSVEGLRLSGAERLPVGETVWVTLPGIEPRRATVIWCQDFTAGCAFTDPLHPAVFDAIVARAQR
ncbi:PilZ domain-containing protein [Novosphingobium sp. KCTC 2891]|uniref:PilZ domain-containing protein n=1 Tax=Novosphingobium sp. KCTC 2891 TaxID=2989730 RepID=UPI0022216E8F|nr:PilZ domain-containing protein [Novosphingobium sp. KCTC 2891]MCW1383399.1 PilZ domain-containing protein [Novosphingobium sp. KCTC 2891]